MEKIKYKIHLLNKLCVAVFIIGLLVPIVFTVYEMGYLSKEPLVEVQPKVTAADAPVLRFAVAYDFSPHSYLDADKKLTGMNVELALEMANRLGVKPELETGDWPECRRLMDERRVDVLMGLEVFSNMQGVLKTIPVDSDKMKVFGKQRIDNFGMLAGKRVGLMAASVIEAIYDFNCEYVEYKTNTDILRAIASGEVDYGICHNAVAEKIIREYNLDLVPSMTVIRSAPAIGVAAEHPELRNRLNRIIGEMTSDGTISRLESKWMTQTVRNRSIANVFRAYEIFFIAYPLLWLMCLMLLFLYNAKYRRQQKHILTLLRYQERLKMSARETKMANSAKTEFLAHMSHDIRTPINGIMGMLQIIEQKRDDKEKVDDCLRKIGSASEHLLSLINDVLDLSRLESGSLDCEEKAFDAYDELNALDDICSVQAREKGLVYEDHAAKLEHTQLVGSTLYMRRILLNLFSNAVKYNKPGGRIDTYARELAMRDGLVRLEFKITDTGIGMSKDFVEKRLFAPFIQEHDDARSQYNGTGLGMAIVKKLVDLMGGEVSVESTLGKGTTFTVVLPFKIATEAELQTQEAPISDISDMHVLVAEDNQLNLEISQFMLENAKAVVTVAHNGREAVEAFKKSSEGSIDAILMDVMMPQLNGLEATQEIRALERADAKSVPIIAVTANAFAEDVQKALAAGMNDHIAKPVDNAKLLETLGKYYWKDKQEKK